MWIMTGLIALSVALRRKLGGVKGTVVALLIAALAASLAQAIVLSALPIFGRELDAPATDVAWVLTAFMLASAVATPIAGRLGDLFGYRRVLFGCLGCLAVGALVAAIGTMTGSLALLVAGRAVQGISGGVFPLAFGIVRATVPTPRLPGVIALLSAMFGIGGAVGLVVAGALVDGLGTTSLSWAILALAVIALVTASALPVVPPPSTGRIDFVGAVVLSGALVCLLLAISQGRSWGWATAAALGAAAVVLLAVFTVHQLRRHDPLVEIRLLRQPALATTNVATLVVGAAMFGGITVVPQFVQTPSAAGYGFGYSPTEVGLMMLPIAAAMLVASPLSARLGRRHPRLPLQLGAASAAVGYGVLVVGHDHLWQFYVVDVLIGAGYGLAFASVGNLVVNAVEPHHTGMTTGVNTIVRTVGGAVGAQLAAALLTGNLSESGYVTAFLVFAIVAVLALATAFAIPTARRVAYAAA
jgi:MFS family permease